MDAVPDDLAGSLVADAPVGLLVTGLNGKPLMANKAYLRLACRTLEEIRTLRPADLVHPDDQADFLSGATLVLHGQIEQFEQDRRLIRPDQTFVWVHGTTALSVDENGVPRHFVTYVHEITARREAEDVLRASEAQYRAVLDAMQEGIVVFDAEQRVVSFNTSAPLILGVTADQLLRREPMDPEWRQILPDGTPLSPADEPVAVALRDGELRSEVTIGIERGGGVVSWLSVTAKPLFRSGETRPYAAMCTFVDITARTEAEAALRASEERFRTLAEALPLALYRTDSEGRYSYVNPTFEALTGVRCGSASDLRLLDVVHPDDRTEVLQAVQRSITTGRYHARYRIVGPDGAVRWASSHAVPVRDDDRVTGFLGCVEDITPLVEAQEQTDRLAAIVETTSDAIAVLEPSGAVAYLNQAARRRLGHEGIDLAGVSAEHLFLDITDRLHDEILPRLRRGEQWTGELSMPSAQEGVAEVSATFVPEFDATGELARIATISRDITHRKRVEAFLTHQATHDGLTELPNRTLFLEHLELAMTRASLTGQSMALLFLDIDRFKWVNDRLGHDAGDEMLREVADRLRSVTRDGDTVARLGGDEFVVLCPGVRDEEEAVAVAGRVLGALERKPFVSGDLSMPITASIGIALSNGGDHPEGLLREADAAMYRAKGQGRARFELFDDAMRARSLRRTELTEQLSLGLSRGEVVCWYQPTVDLTTGAYVGVEALARWMHPTRGLLLPSEFIELAEETGLIGELGSSILHQAVTQARVWSEQLGPAAPVVHVNLSPRQLARGDLVAVVRAALAGSGLDPGLLCLEITENALVDDVASAVDALRELKALGVRLAIDDFGTGYSSLAYLRRFPVDVLKVDRSFVDGLGPDPEDSAIVAAVVKLAHTLEMEAVAEGVETEGQLAQLRTLGCDLAQGFLFSPPRPAPDITHLLLTSVLRPLERTYSA